MSDDFPTDMSDFECDAPMVACEKHIVCFLTGAGVFLALILVAAAVWHYLPTLSQ